MSSTLIAIVMVIYLCVALSYYYEGKIGMAIAFAAYALANAGFIVANFEK